MSLELRDGAPAGALVRFARNRVSLTALRAGALGLERQGARTRALVVSGRGKRRVHVTLSARAGRATLAVDGRTTQLRGHFVAERAVRVRHGHGIGRVRVKTSGPGAESATTPGTKQTPSPAQDAVAAPPPAETAAPASAPSPSLIAAPVSPGRLFATDSVWNTPLASTAPLDPQSNVLVKTLRDTVAANLAAGSGPWIERGATSPLYTVPANQPTVRVQLDPGSWKVGLQQTFEAVPIPPNAAPAPGPDAHMTIYQPSTSKLWEFFKARKLADGWHANFGGSMSNTSQSPGYFNTDSWPGLSQSWWGATATSLPVIAGTIMISELQAGVIPHALALNLPWARPSQFSWPAQRTDGTSTDPNAIPEGARFRLDPALNIDNLNLPPMTKMMARAVQRYGMIVRDQTGHAVSFFAENPSQHLAYYGSDPYSKPGGFYGGLVPTQLTRPFPWEHLQLVKMTLSG